MTRNCTLGFARALSHVQHATTTSNAATTTDRSVADRVCVCTRLSPVSTVPQRLPRKTVARAIFITGPPVAARTGAPPRNAPSVLVYYYCLRKNVPQVHARWSRFLPRYCPRTLRGFFPFFRFSAEPMRSRLVVHATDVKFVKTSTSENYDVCARTSALGRTRFRCTISYRNLCHQTYINIVVDREKFV